MRPLYTIAAEIRQAWPRINPHAENYVKCMATMDKVSDGFGCDPGKEIVLYFLSNAQGWRGETARRVKKELKAMAGY